MSMSKHAHLIAVLALLLGACAPLLKDTARDTATETATATKRAATQVPENFPDSDYAQAAAQGQPVYRVDPARSLVAITVRRGGTLARLGHDHVVASHDVQGYVALDAGRADLYIPLSELTVDEPALRAQAGLDTQPSASDIAGTRSNMLDKVLEVQQFPFALIHVSGLEKAAAGARLAVAITLRGVTRQFEVPAQLDSGRGEMNVTGVLEFKQSDFGIVPFAILGGAISVQDGLSLRFSIHARQNVNQ